MSWRKVVVFAVLLTTACSGTELDSMDEDSSDVPGGKSDYFGADDRRQPNEDGLPPGAIDWARATALLAEQSDIEETEDGLRLRTKPLGEYRRLCDDAPFVSEPHVSACSSFLVAEDIIVTAGHCTDGRFRCEDAAFVFDFGYYDDTRDPASITEEQVYGCEAVLEQVYEGDDLEDLDYALIRLDRPVRDREPLPVRRQGNLKSGDSVTLVGYPDGIPVKVDSGGTVFHAGETRFVSTSDSFSSNSGSVVVNSRTGEVEAVHVSSAGSRYDYDAEGVRTVDGSPRNGCYYATQCWGAEVESGDCQGAVGVYTRHWLEALDRALNGGSNPDAGGYGGDAGHPDAGSGNDAGYDDAGNVDAGSFDAGFDDSGFGADAG